MWCRCARLLQRVDGRHEKILLVERIRKTSRASSLVPDGFNKAHRRQVDGLSGGNEIVNIVFRGLPAQNAQFPKYSRAECD